MTPKSGDPYHDPRSVSGETQRGVLRAQPGALTRRRAVVVVVLAYSLVVMCVRGFLAQVEAFHGYDDSRDEQMTSLFAFVMAIFAVRSVLLIMRRPSEPIL